MVSSPDEALAERLREAGITLSVVEARTIAERLGRGPSLVELHAFAAQWSEHCSYKSSRRQLARLPVEGPGVILGPGQDAGIVELGSWQGTRFGIVVAHESHNHPSQVVPFEGAATGIGGIVRDVLCMGARLIALADPLRFGPRDDPHCRYVAQGVVDGIAAYGNAIGVPTIAGDVFFDEGFRDNVLVNVIALGIVEADAVIPSSAPSAEDYEIVLVGKATDRSGFGGAAFSSLALDERDAEANKGAVQVPDPFLKNVLMRATYRAFEVVRERKLAVAFKDLGAGGILGCTAELAFAGGFGAEIDLGRVPTAQEGLPDAVLAVGETQERLAWAVPSSFVPALLAIYNEEFGLPDVAAGAGAAAIGRILTEPRYVARRGERVVLDLPIDFLCGGIRYERSALPAACAPGDDARTPLSDRAASLDLRALLLGVLAHRDVCSRRSIFERFDSVVRGATAIPAGEGDAGVVVPVPGAPLGVALGVGGNPRYARLDIARAAEGAVCEAVRNVVAVGAEPAALTDCLNFGDPEEPAQMGEFTAAVDGLASAAHALGLAFVSGNVSLYNTSAGGGAIPGSPIVACVGRFADIADARSLALDRAGRALVLVGSPQNALGGSVVAELAGLDDPRLVDARSDALANELRFVLDANRRGLVGALHDLSDGGLLVALAEMAFASSEPLGIRVTDPALWAAGAGTLEALFGEYGAFVLATGDASATLALARECGVACVAFGETTTEPLLVVEGVGQAPDAQRTLRLPLAELRRAWSTPLADFYDEVPSAGAAGLPP
ncbi:MAG: phosphoribosylformylglycinamidine synthase subunit PurL [Vulcanimicrobiaceae bacterium]